MVEIFILLILLFNYIIPYTGIVKLSKGEKQILEAYEHTKLRLEGNSEELVASDTNGDSPMNSDGTFNTMEILGDINSESKGKGKNKEENEDYENVNLGELMK